MDKRTDICTSRVAVATENKQKFDITISLKPFFLTLEQSVSNGIIEKSVCLIRRSTQKTSQYWTVEIEHGQKYRFWRSAFAYDTHNHQALLGLLFFIIVSSKNRTSMSIIGIDLLLVFFHLLCHHLLMAKSFPTRVWPNL